MVHEIPGVKGDRVTGENFQAPKTKAAPKITAACEHTGVTLTRFMLEVSKANPELEELPALFSGISTACKAIANAVKRSQLTGLTGLEGGGPPSLQMLR